MARRTTEHAVTEALQLRQRMGYSLEEPLCAITLAEDLGIQVRFKALPSLEGLYVAGSPPLIVLGSQRPSGRRNYTCAHELGHHVFGDAYSLDSLTDQKGEPRNQRPEEYLANRFAAALLMPKIAVCAAFAHRRWQAEAPHPLQALIVATHLRVGYRTLVTYMQRTLHLLAACAAKRLLKLTPQQIRFQALGTLTTGSLFVVEKDSTVSPLDVETGDVLITPPDTVLHGNSLEPTASLLSRPGYIVKCPGTTILTFPDRGSPLTIRAARRAFEGLSTYRHLEETDHAT